MAKQIGGIALMPRESRNGIYYDVEELKKFDGVQVPLRVEHGGPNTNIGQVTFAFNDQTSQVTYTAQVTDEKWQGILDNEAYQVSIGASVLEQRELCDQMKSKCLNAPVLKDIIELSVVRTPGIPEATMNVLEGKNVLFEKIINEADNIDQPLSSFNGFIDSQALLGELVQSITAKAPDTAPEEVQRKAMEIVSGLEKAFTSILTPPQPVAPVPEQPQSITVDPPTQDNTSNIESPQSSTMTTEIPTDVKSEKVEEKVKVTIETDGEVEVGKAEATKTEASDDEKCPEGKKMVAGKCVDAKQESTPESSDLVKATEALTSVIENVGKAWEPKSQVAESTESNGFVEEAFTDVDAKQFMDKLFETGYNKLVMDKEGWIEEHTVPGAADVAGNVTEAVSTSGTISGVKQRSNISIQLGSKTATPLRQYGQFEAIPTGQNTARFYRITNPDAGAITESPTTDITAVTHTLTAIDVTCSIRGWRQVVEKANLEDYPASFLNALRETARLEAIRDEHKLILQDLGATDHDFGGVSTAPYHIGGSDGVATTTTTEEDADGAMDEDGITKAKMYLGKLGNSTAPGQLIAFLSEEAFEALISSTGLSEYTQIGNANVTRLGQLERLYGVDIIVTNELLQANNADRNLVCVKGKAWGLASQRKMEIEFQKNIAGQYFDIVWTHRIGVDIIDPNTYIIVSTVAT
jgi:hypothetical protein